MDATIGDTGAVTFGAFMLDPVRRRVSRGGAPIIMPARQFDLLLYLVRNPGRVVEKDELLSAVWGGELGRKDDAEKRLAKIHAALGDDGGTVYADIYAQRKRPDDALTWLKKAYARHDPALVELNVRWELDPIRDTVCFRNIEHRMNFPL